MTVKELIRLLRKESPNAQVKTTHHEEGNYYAPVVSVTHEVFGSVVIYHGNAETPVVTKKEPA